MADPYVGFIQHSALNFAPTGFLPCTGGLYSVTEFTALFSLIGTTWGGDGRSNFQVPDYRGRMVLGSGSPPLLSSEYPLGSLGGTEWHKLQTSEMPAHNHAVTSNKIVTTAKTFLKSSYIESTATVSSDNAGVDSNVPTGRYPGPNGAVDRFSSDLSNPTVMAGDFVEVDSTLTSLDLNTEVTLGIGILETMATGIYDEFDIRQPIGTCNYIIASNGVYPPH